MIPTCLLLAMTLRKSSPLHIALTPPTSQSMMTGEAANSGMISAQSVLAGIYVVVGEHHHSMNPGERCRLPQQAMSTVLNLKIDIAELEMFVDQCPH